MRRIIHNTTAIAACLSLLTPHLALAQTGLPEDAAQEQQAGAAEAEVTTPPDAFCEDGTTPPCAASVDGDSEIVEPETGDIEAGEADATDPQTDSPTEAAAEEPAAEAEDQAGAADPQPEPVEAPAADAADDDVTAGEPAADVGADVEAQAPDESASAVDSGAGVADTPDVESDALDEAPAQQEQQQDAAPADPAEADFAEDTGAPAADAATVESDADALARALAEQEQAGSNSTDVSESDAIPEQGLPETETAREAAEAAEAPVAAALDDSATSDAQTTEEQVTEDSRRSSSEDFAASLRDALTAATGQQPSGDAATQPVAADERSDRNDLARALLLGLGGIAVGAMLTNNRQVALSTPDRVVLTRPDGSQQIIKDEVALLRQPGSTVTTENFDDGSSRTIVTRPDGSRVVTIRDADLRVLRRTLISADGTTTRLIDDSVAADAVDIGSLPPPARPVQPSSGQMNEEDLRAALQREANVDRGFTLAQIRNIPEVRALVAPVNIDAITFDTGSAAIRPDQAQQLSTLGNVIRDMVAANPREILLIEGHTDTVGAEAMNLALSDRRAESVALALAEYFDVPPENMVVQGYGEQFLKVRQEGDVRENRRASVRRITELLRTASD